MNPQILASLVPVIFSMIQQGQGKDAEQGSTYTKEHQGLLQSLVEQLKSGIGGQNQDITQNQGYQTGQDYLQSMFNDPEFFKRFEAPMMRQYEEEIIPGLANRFASMGSGGSLGSTGFRNQLAREGSNLQTNIAAMRGQMQQNAVPQLLNYAQQPVSNWQNQMNSLQPTQNQYKPATPGPWGNTASALVGAGSQAWGDYWGSQSAPKSASSYDNDFRNSGVPGY